MQGQSPCMLLYPSFVSLRERSRNNQKPWFVFVKLRANGFIKDSKNYLLFSLLGSALMSESDLVSELDSVSSLTVTITLL